MPPESLNLLPISGIPLIQPGDDLSVIILKALDEVGIALQAGDVLVVSSKIVSKAENRFVDLSTVSPGEEALRLAGLTFKDPRIVELVLRESQAVSRAARNVLVTRHRLGFVSANAGIDQSNVGRGQDTVLLLPLDPDASAAALRASIREQTGVDIGVVISDSHGRPFRLGNVGAAIGVAGLPALRDLRGQSDLFGRTLAISVMGYADLIASAAHLVCGEGDEGIPVVLLRGLSYDEHETNGRAEQLNRPPEQDLYR
jgi:coenzyme F420-0:L-glutamate ligase / coenzyme F420-1:gamma-L-glutamate ligase